MFGSRSFTTLRRLSYCWILVFVSGVILYAIYILGIELYKGSSLQYPENSEFQNVFTAFFVNSSACRIPALDPWSDMVKPYLQRKRREFKCPERWNSPNIERKFKNLICCHTPFHKNNSTHPDDEVQYEKTCTKFWGEFLRITCNARKTAVYKGYRASVVRKPKVEERCKKKSAESDSDALSVLVLGIDSISHLNLHRQMPKTIKRLMMLDAIEMLGFNTVADETFPNLIPLLTGLSEEELKRACWSSQDEFFDKCHFIWNDFRDTGYRTVFVEEVPNIGMFNYIKKGFKTNQQIITYARS